MSNGKEGRTAPAAARPRRFLSTSLSHSRGHARALLQGLEARFESRRELFGSARILARSPARYHGVYWNTHPVGGQREDHHLICRRPDDELLLHGATPSLAPGSLPNR